MNFEEEGEAFSTLDVEYFCLHTHPARLDFEHATWDQFAKDLTSACKSIFPQHIPQYKIKELDALFREQFNFSTEIWHIPSIQSENRLEMKIGEVKSNFGGDGQLLIVYYGGHGKFDRNGRSIWQAWQNRHTKAQSPTLQWDSLQPMLKRCPSDVLILLDCCYAASAARGDVSGTNKVLAACGREVEALGVCDRSFTQNLMRKLRSFGKNQPFTVKELYVRLLKDRKRLVTTPHYAPLSGRDRLSICITPCRPTHAVLDNDTPRSMGSSSASQVDSHQPSAASDSFTGDSASTSATSMSPGSLSPMLEGPRVLLALSLSADAGVPDLEQWKRWISTEAPYNIRNVSVRFEATYESHSTLVLISMPTSVWQCLPDSSAYRFIDFIRSDNLMTDDRSRVDTANANKAFAAQQEVNHPSLVNTGRRPLVQRVRSVSRVAGLMSKTKMPPEYSVLYQDQANKHRYLGAYGRPIYDGSPSASASQLSHTSGSNYASGSSQTSVLSQDQAKKYHYLAEYSRSTYDEWLASDPARYSGLDAAFEQLTLPRAAKVPDSAQFHGLRRVVPAQFVTLSHG